MVAPPANIMPSGSGSNEPAIARWDGRRPRACGSVGERANAGRAIYGGSFCRPTLPTDRKVGRHLGKRAVSALHITTCEEDIVSVAVSNTAAAAAAAAAAGPPAVGGERTAAGGERYCPSVAASHREAAPRTRSQPSNLRRLSRDTLLGIRCCFQTPPKVPGMLSRTGRLRVDTTSPVSRAYAARRYRQPGKLPSRALTLR